VDSCTCSQLVFINNKDTPGDLFTIRAKINRVYWRHSGPECDAVANEEGSLGVDQVNNGIPLLGGVCGHLSEVGMWRLTGGRGYHFYGVVMTLNPLTSL